MCICFCLKNVSFYEECMYLLHDTNHGTFPSTFYLIYWPKMKMKTCQFRNISDLAMRSTSSRQFFEIHLGCEESKFLDNPSKPFLMIIVGFVINKDVSTSDPFDQDIVRILDSSKYLAEYICQVSLADRTFLVYSDNAIKAAHTGGGFSVLQLLSLPIVYITNVLAGDNRRELDVTIADAVVITPRQGKKFSSLTFCWPMCKTF